jgi:hypothetical protein
MTVRKVVAGSVLVAGVGVAGILGAGSAAAAPAPNQPGVSVSVNGGPAVGFGDAHAKSSTGSAAVAINLNAPAKASAFGKGNTALAVGVLGPSLAEAVGHNNSAVSALGGSAGSYGENNHTFTAGGTASNTDGKADTTDDGRDNNVVTVFGVTQAVGDGNFAVGACGGAVGYSGNGYFVPSHAAGSIC